MNDKNCKNHKTPGVRVVEIVETVENRGMKASSTLGTHPQNWMLRDRWDDRAQN
jgi:hypothetical protein